MELEQGNELVRVNIDGETGGELVLRTGKSPDVFVYGGVNYTVHSTRGLVDLVMAKGAGPKHVVIFYTKSGIRAVLDDRIETRPRDMISLEFRYSVQFCEWKEILGGKYLDQKQFTDFLKRREGGEILHVEELMAALHNFRYVQRIDGDFSFADSENYTFAVKVQDAEGTVQIPKLISANIEVFLESGFFQKVEIEVEVSKPKDESSRPLFLLSCPKVARYLDEAVRYEINTLREELPEYLIVAGDPIASAYRSPQ